MVESSRAHEENVVCLDISVLGADGRSLNEGQQVSLDALCTGIRTVVVHIHDLCRFVCVCVMYVYYLSYVCVCGNVNLLVCANLIRTPHNLFTDNDAVLHKYEYVCACVCAYVSGTYYIESQHNASRSREAHEPCRSRR